MHSSKQNKNTTDIIQNSGFTKKSPYITIASTPIEMTPTSYTILTSNNTLSNHRIYSSYREFLSIFNKFIMDFNYRMDTLTTKRNNNMKWLSVLSAS